MKEPVTISTEGIVAEAPNRWLHVEAAVLLAACLIAYASTHRTWWLVPAVLFLPDLLMVGYIRGPRLGAVLYNIAHNAALPALLAGFGWWQDQSLTLAIGLVWLAHIGMDRVMGYGLKYNDSFRHTHLGVIGREKSGTSDPA